METEGPLPCQQEPTTGTYPQPTQSTPHPHILFARNNGSALPSRTRSAPDIATILLQFAACEISLLMNWPLLLLISRSGQIYSQPISCEGQFLCTVHEMGRNLATLRNGQKFSQFMKEKKFSRFT